MMDRTPDDTLRAYERFLRRKEYEKAYCCLENLLKEFPADEELLENIIWLCLNSFNRPYFAQRWLLQIIKIRTFLPDYLALSHLEATHGNINKAKQYLATCREFLRPFPSVKQKKKFENSCNEVQQIIAFRTSRETNPKQPVLRNTILTPMAEKKIKVELSTPIENIKKTFLSIVIPQRTEIPEYSVPVTFSPVNEEKLRSFLSLPIGALQEGKLILDFEELLIQGGFNELVCLNSISEVDHYWYQIETVKRVLKLFHGRVLLCDEVGLGKTIEAAMIVKEYLMRQMARNVLILTPPSLVAQWKEEMSAKFHLEFTTTDDEGFRKDPKEFWKNQRIIASLNTAKSSKNLEHLRSHFYDLVVVDEAHHLRNRTTLSWQMVNLIQKKFILLLTATPVQNNLIELYNLITLLKPGQFKTEKIFKQEFLEKGQTRKPANKEKLRELLKDVMIRNTRSAIDVKLPKRFATTLRLQPTENEEKIYQWLTEYLRRQNTSRFTRRLLLTEAGSSPFALRKSLLNVFPIEDIQEVVSLIDQVSQIAKTQALLDLLRRKPEEKKIIFTQYLKSMEYLGDFLTKHEIPFVFFKGEMSNAEKNEAIRRFKEEIPVLISTESGGEGRNIQFCNTIINFDLPWNPMRIEQRIGRLHRIGQKQDVFIFNLSVKGTLEDHIIDILDNKINMFEMVIGEIEPILGRIGQDEEFEDVIMEIWMNSKNDDELRSNFGQLGDQMKNAKQEYLQSKALDDKIFGQDYET
ncbi:MAG TPA: SNF2-related protein [Candidatus Omnitrophota bacterium]|nr:SNF2-related protein [Candidatus Omnitrophota bacterium]